MNITRENIDELNAVLKLDLVENDYVESVAKVLKDYKKSANIPGFRPGKVPLGIINRMYRKPVLVDEINKLVSDTVTKYIVEEKINILGEPLPHNEEGKVIDWENDKDFEFKFDLGLAPEFELKLSAKDKIPYYNIKVDDTLIDKYTENYTQRLGSYTSEEDVQEKDILTVSVEQLDEKGEVKEDGIKNDEARVSVEIIKDDEIKKSVLKAKKGDSISIDLNKAYPNVTEIESILKVDKAIAETVTGEFRITINEVQRFKNAEVDQDLFNKIYGEGVVNSTDEFRTKIAEEASDGLKHDSEYKFKIDIKDSLVSRFKENLPVEFLKRWLFVINEGKFTMEEIEKDFDKFAEDLKWQLIKDKIAKENDIQVVEEDVREAAKDSARMQFSQYGMNNVPDEHLESFAQKILEDREQIRKLGETKLEDKVIEYIRETVKIENKDITGDKFKKMIEEAN